MALKCTLHLMALIATVLLGHFKNVVGYVSDPPNLVHFWRIRHGCDNTFRESEQHRITMLLRANYIPCLASCFKNKLEQVELKKLLEHVNTKHKE